MLLEFFGIHAQEFINASEQNGMEDNMPKDKVDDMMKSYKIFTKNSVCPIHYLLSGEL